MFDGIRYCVFFNIILHAFLQIAPDTDVMTCFTFSRFQIRFRPGGRTGRPSKQTTHHAEANTRLAVDTCSHGGSLAFNSFARTHMRAKLDIPTLDMTVYEHSCENGIAKN